MKMLNQVRQSDAPTDVHQEWSNKFKVSAVAAAITSLICTSIPSYAADLEIYKIPEDSTGATTLLLMLDTSGSMAWNMGNTNTASAGNSRLDILKKGLKEVLEGTATTPRVDDKIVMGLATFTNNNGYIRVPAKSLGTLTGNQVQDGVYKKPRWIRYTKRTTTTNRWGQTTNTDTFYYNTCSQWDPNNYNCLKWDGDTTSSTGYNNASPYKYNDNTDCTYGNRNDCRYVWEEIPKYRDETHRDTLLTTINGLVATGGTPTPYAYAEAASYMMGTRTTAPISYTVTIGNSNTSNSDYYSGCSSYDLRTLTGRGANAGQTLDVAWCANSYVGNVPSEVLNTTNYAVFEYRHDRNTTRKVYYQIRDYDRVTTENQEIGNSKTDGTGYTKCNTLKSQTEDVTGTSTSSGTTLRVKRCNTTTTGTVPTGTLQLIYGNSSNRRILYYRNTEVSRVSVPKPTPFQTDPYSGWSNSTNDSKPSPVSSATHYDAPASIQAQLGDTEAARAKKECSGQGIYFLTDGEPTPSGNTPNITTTSDGKSGTAYQLMSSSLGSKSNLFSCAGSQLGKRINADGDPAYGNEENNTWSCIGKYAETLLDPTKNPVGLEIKTAVVGFSSSFSSDTNPDVQDAKEWGTIGKGKWYVGTNSQSVVDSINNFIDEINKDIPSMSTGSSTVPMDALNPEIIQPYAYFPQFEPKIKPEDTQQLWFGNVKKYYVINNGVYSSASGGAANTVVLKSKLQDLTDIWAKSGVTYGEGTAIFKKGGALSQLKLGTETSTDDKGTSVTMAGRKLLTDYVFDNTKTEPISRNFDLNRIDYTYTTNASTKTDDAGRVRGLMALLGYNISSDTETNNLILTNTSATLRQMGSVYHSLPVLLTQEGKAVASKNATTGKVQISTTGRKDYVLFGTTQGLLSVVDADSGVEKFSFVPKEMIEKQSETFKENAGTLAGGKNALYYGIDGEWVAHTVYVTKSDGTLTVKGAARNAIGTKEDKENLKGKQWVYGGMRMGGRSYYSLDLTDIDNPKLKFHIDPSTGKVYSAANPTGKSFPEIENMAQSWSKPKLDYIDWKGQRKLVMFVGGGYDAGGDNGDGTWANGIRTGYAGYETYNYQQINKKGAGVYMFDADTGDLLWYADANTPTATSSDTGGNGGTSTAESIPHLVNGDLKYSVVSEIKTVDRNNDGMVDHLYFGDLAGQAFRIDFGRSKTAFISQSTKILNLHQTDGTSPRFYLPPVFTAHYSEGKKEGENVVVVSFVSGNKSSPLLATTDSPASTGKKDTLGLQYDGVYAIYDYDIHPNGQYYPNTNIAARTLASTNATNISINQLKYISNSDVVRNDTDTALVKGAVADSTSGWGGWYYRFDKKFSTTGLSRENAGASIIKGLSPLVAMEGSLYVTMYDASNNGTSSSCGAGVKGHSFTQRLCLPTGVCRDDANYIYNLGSGIVSLNVGSIDGGNSKSIVVPDPADIGVGCIGTGCGSGSKFITAGGSMRFIPNRWYERYAKRY